MKTMTRILGLTAVLAVVALAVPVAQANCIPGTTFSTWNPVEGRYSYVALPAGANPSNIVGKFWAKGNFATANNGSYDDSIWLRLYAPTNKWYISGDTSSGMIGCPNGNNMILSLDLADGSTLVLESVENPGSSVRWDFSTLGVTNFAPAPKPRPQVASSSRSGTSVNVTLNVQAQSGGYYGPQAAVAAAPTYQLVVGTGSSDPGSSAANYTAAGAMTPGTPLPTSVDCTNTATDKWLAIQELVDGQGSATVGPRTRVSCNPALADPDFKHIDRPGRPNPRSGR